MSDFAADWLALREPADVRARSRTVVRPLQRPYAAIVDLGAGTGANLRWLAPLLGPDQKWVLIDKDSELLAEAVRATQRWAARSGFDAGNSRGRSLSIAGPGFDCTMTTRALDLSRDPGSLDLPRDCLLTASALLDLVSEAWLSQLIDQAAGSAACVHFALSYDGAIALDPAAADDLAVVSLFNRHQATDKGFGPALGPRASQVAAELLDGAGYEVLRAGSVWRCGAADRSGSAGSQQSDDRELMAALIEGWAAAAAAIAPAEAGRISLWRAARLALAAEGALALTVGHDDLSATPP